MENYSNGEPNREGFWKRQFSDVPTLGQIIFDILLGIIAPILCLYFDPVLFHNNIPCSNMGPLAPPYPIFTYTAVGLGIIILTTWHVFYYSITRGLEIIAGAFFTGTILAITIGILLLPASLIGLLICVGLLGFIPFLTAFVYFRNGIRALLRARQQNPAKSIGRTTANILMGALLILCIPIFLQWQSPHLFPQLQVAPQPYSCGGD